MKYSHEQVWNNCLASIQKKIPLASYKTWFEPIKPMKLDNNVLTIQVPSTFFYEYIEDKFIAILQTTLTSHIGSDAKLEYSIQKPKNNFTNFNPPPKEKTKPQVSEPTGEKQIKNPFVIPGIRKLHIDSRLNPANTLDNFISGKCNELARNAALKISKEPGSTSFNPLMLYGNSGVGKTHLAQAIGWEIKKNFINGNEKVVLYTTANTFQTQYTEAVRNNDINDFLNFYQMIDVLIIDDIHDFIGKDKTQNTFFHIFNQLHQSGKQLILTSDRAPAQLDGLEDRLLSRFRWGLTADLLMPDFETRLSILRHKLRDQAAYFPDDVLQYLAKNIKTSIREIEGVIISTAAIATLNKTHVTISMVDEVISKLVKPVSKEINVETIKNVVAEYFNIDVVAMQAKSRKRNIVNARQIAMYFCKELTNLSYSAIGAAIGRKDHATVVHACRTVANMIDTDAKFKNDLTNIRKRFEMY